MKNIERKIHFKADISLQNKYLERIDEKNDLIQIRDVSRKWIL